MIDLNDKKISKLIKFLIRNSPQEIAEKKNMTLESATHYKMWAEYLMEKFNKNRNSASN
jgi:hypothetical protein